MAQKIYTDLDVKGKISSSKDEIVLNNLSLKADVAGTIATTDVVDSKISTAIEAIQQNHFPIEGAFEVAPETTLTQYFTNNPDIELKDGDTAVVKTPITADAATPASYTAFVYDAQIVGASKWVAMDGNYNAENVYFAEDMTITYPFGKYTIPSTGSNTLPAKGKSLQDVLRDALLDTKDPVDPTLPKLTISSSSAGSYEVGTQFTASKPLTISVEGTYGTYQYGPATGVQWNTYSAEVTGTVGGTQVLSDIITTPKTGSFSNGSAKATATASFAMKTVDDGTATLTICDNTSLTIKLTGEQAAATEYADNNVGEDSTKTIAAKSHSVTTGSITGYRKWFWGYKTAATKLSSIDLLNSSVVRALGNNGKALPSTLTTTDMQQIFFAIPSSEGKTSVTVINSSNDAPQPVYSLLFNEDPSLDKSIKVEGANGFDAVSYDIFYVNNDNPASGSNTFKITVA